MKTTHATLCLVVTSALGSSGCISPFGPEDLRFRLSVANKVGIARDFAVGVDGLTLRLAAAITKVDVPLDGIHWVDFGAYTLRGSARGIVSNAHLPGYECMMRQREGGEEIGLFVRQSSSSVKSTVVLIREGSELKIARVRGRLDALLAKVLEDGAFGFDVQRLLESDSSPPAQVHVARYGD